MTTLCTHFKKNSLYHGYDNGYILQSNQIVENRSLETYLSCQKCAVMTPTLGYRVPGALGALVRLVCYTILRPFAALIGLAIRSDIDSTQHPIWAKIGRILTIPSNYWGFEWTYFKGYLFFDNSGKARIIGAQAYQSMLRKYIHAQHAHDFSNLFPSTFPGCKEVSLDEREKYRLSNLRERGTPLRLLNFQDLIQEGYLIIVDK